MITLWTKVEAIEYGACKFVVVDSVLRLVPPEIRHSLAVEDEETATDAGYILIGEKFIVLQDNESLSLRVSCTDYGIEILEKFFGLPVRLPSK